MRFEAQTKKGIYVDDDEFASIHPGVLQRYLGMTKWGVIRHPHQTGAGNPPEEEDSDEDSKADIPHNLGDRMRADQQGNITHPAIEVPSKTCPFGVAGLALFKEVYEQATSSGVIPRGYGIQEDEWEDGEYTSVETLKTGRKRKELTVSLPDSVWRPRAENWVRGLECMSYVLYALE